MHASKLTLAWWAGKGERHGKKLEALEFEKENDQKVALEAISLKSSRGEGGSAGDYEKFCVITHAVKTVALGLVEPSPRELRGF